MQKPSDEGAEDNLDLRDMQNMKNLENLIKTDHMIH